MRRATLNLPVLLVMAFALTAAGCSAGTPKPAPTVTRTVTTKPVTTSGDAGTLQPESCQRVSSGADGNVSPVLCPDGHPNAYAMPTLESTASAMFSLGEFATTGQIENAACRDLPHSTNPIEQSAYQFMQALNGWQFGIDPTDNGLFSYCQP